MSNQSTASKTSKTPAKKAAAPHDDSHQHDHHDHAGHDHAHDHSDHTHDHHDHSHDDSIIAPNTTVEVTFTWAEVEPVYKEVIRKSAQKLKLSGFRPGKVPPHIAETQLDHEKVVNAVLDQILPQAYSQVIAKTKKQPLTSPRIKSGQVDKGSDWKLILEIAEAPEIKLGNYQKTVKAAKKDAENEIKKLTEERQKAAKEAEAAQKKAAKTDKTASATPAPATTELSDKDVSDIRLKNIMSQLVSELKPAVPELLVQEETRRDLDQLVNTLDQLKMKLDDYLKRRGISFEQLTQEMAIQAVSRLQVEFVLQALASDQKLEATEADVDQQINTIQDEKVRAEQAKNPSYRRYVSGLVVRQKTLDFLLAA